MNARPVPPIVLCAALLAAPACKRSASHDAPGDASSSPSGLAANAAAARTRDPRASDAESKVYRGKVGTSAIVLRLRDEGGKLGGRYFYESRGETLELDGLHTPDDRYTLHERVDGQITGHMVLSKGATGLVGDWLPVSDKAKKAPVTLEETKRPAASDRATVIARYWRARFKPEKDLIAWRKEHNAQGAPDAPCSADVAFPELANLSDGNVEAALNDLLLEKRTESWPEGCQSGPEHKTGFSVFANQHNVFSYCQDLDVGSGPWRPSQWYPRRCATYDLTNGRAIQPDDVISASKKESFQLAVKDATRDLLIEAGEDKSAFDRAAAEMLAGPLVVSKCSLLFQRDTSMDHHHWNRRLYEVSFDRIRTMVDPKSPIFAIVSQAPSPCRGELAPK